MYQAPTEVFFACLAFDERNFDYLLDHQESGQVIFIDQKEKMPTWLGANSQCKYHEFTKSREQGRYGLLTDVYDEE